MATSSEQLNKQKSSTTQSIGDALEQSDRIVAMVAFELARLSFAPMLELEDEEFTGALYVLSGFTPAQLAGFVDVATQETGYQDRLQIRFPASKLAGFGIHENCLINSSAVSVRNSSDRIGKVVITSDMEDDVGASLGNKSTIEADQLKEDPETAQIWVAAVSQIVGINLLEGHAKQVIAMIKGLFECGRFPTGMASRFISAVLGEFKEGTPLLRAAGIHLPKLDLPRFEDCFIGLGTTGSGQPSQWRRRFESHQKNDSYLSKRDPGGLLLDMDSLREKLQTLKTETSQMPEAILEAFETYIEAEVIRSQATEALLFDHDWSHVSNCFDKQKKTTSKAFVERTRIALAAEAVTPTQEDEAILNRLSQNPRKSGEATNEFKDFFETHENAIAQDPKLLLEWKDFIYGRRITCEDFFDGIIEYFQRTIELHKPGLETRLEIRGVRQDKPNYFRSADPKICRYFERHYGQLERHSRNRIRFSRTKLPQYSEEVKSVLDKAKKKTRGRKRGNVKGFEFHITAEQKVNGVYERLPTLPLVWSLPKDSVLMLEGRDLDALIVFRNQKGKTALAEGFANYENIGRKGLPLSISLRSVKGFASGAGGRGSFIPAQGKIRSLAAEAKEAISEAERAGWLAGKLIEELKERFSEFDKHYGKAVETLAIDTLDATHVPAMARSYRDLLGKINEVPHENVRRNLLHAILSIGSATIDKSGGRPKLAVICPWHPLRMEAAAARNRQFLSAIDSLLSEQPVCFSDWKTGNLFFRDLRETMSAPLQPEVTVCWEGMEAKLLVVSQSLGSYTLQEPHDYSKENRSFEDNARESAKTILDQVEEYLRLQPHERDNLSVLLYNCDSAELPGKLIDDLNKRNQDNKSEKITCQIVLTHRDEKHLLDLYRDLIAGSDDDKSDIEETTGDFLSRVRINITAANRLKNDGRTQSADIAYCRDILSTEAETVWEWVDRQTFLSEQLFPHQWNRLRPFQEGDRKAYVLFCCPAQTEVGWEFLRSIAFLCTNGVDNAWSNDKCPVPMRMLNFDNQGVERIFSETHDLAVWVVNEDELLDRRLLEQKDIKVVRYIQSTTQGRNLIISSKARDTMLVNSLRERLGFILPTDTSQDLINSLARRLIDDANGISGRLVLKAARRANNTSELIGMVLSRYLVHSEIGLERSVAWCFLDDYSHWLGKKSGASIADLLVLAPTYGKDGKPHLDIIITEAKFVSNDSVSAAKNTSEKQLSDTLAQVSQALSIDPMPLDQNLWLARLSDMILSRITGSTLNKSIDPEEWRYFIRKRECTFSVWGYSHIFVHSSVDGPTHMSNCKGISTERKGTTTKGLQEVFGPDLTRELVLQFYNGSVDETCRMRVQNGHLGFNNIRFMRDLPDITEDIPDTRGPSDDSNGEAIDQSKPVTSNPTEVKPEMPSGNDIQNAEKLNSEMENESIIDSEEHSQNDADKLKDVEPQEALTAFLVKCASQSKPSVDEGEKWLEQTTFKLRQALLARGMAAKIAKNFAPILTPNAAIIKLQGSKDMTVQAVEAKIGEMFTSDELEIISVTPESGRVSIAVARPDRQVLHTPQVFLEVLQNPLSWASGESVFIGIREEDGRFMFLDPLDHPHTLVAGITGSGKSVLIQNFILYIALTQSPDDAQIHLIDAKYGVDYHPLELLPHVENGSGKIIDDPEEAITSLEILVDEMNRRYKLFKEAKVKDYRSYRKITGRPLPSLWVIHDEFADWMQLEEYAKKVPDIVNRLSVKARAAGIFLVFAAQRPDNTVMPMQLRSQLGNRLILKVDSRATSDIAMGQKNAGAEKLLGKGHMLAITGNTPEPLYVQVPYVDMENEVPQIVQLLRRIYGLPDSEELPSV